MSICSTAMSDLGPLTGPLVVKPKVAWKMLQCGNTRGYQLLAAGELESFLDGASRKITVESIHRYIARRVGRTGPSLLRGSAVAPRRRRVPMLRSSGDQQPGRRRSQKGVIKPPEIPPA
jgi:hypothetical protein